MNCRQSFIGVATAVEAEGLTHHAPQARWPLPPAIDADGLPRRRGVRLCCGRKHEAEDNAQSA